LLLSWEIDGEPYTMAEGSYQEDWWRAKEAVAEEPGSSPAFWPRDFKRKSVDGLGIDGGAL
jgi:hypothetical protein